MLLCKVTLERMTLADFVTLYLFREDARNIIKAWLVGRYPLDSVLERIPWAYQHRTEIPGLPDLEVPS